MSQPIKAAATEQQQQPVARSGAASTGNGRNSSQGSRPSGSAPSKSSAQNPTPQQKPTGGSNATNGAEGAAKPAGMSWAARLQSNAAPNGGSAAAAQEKPAAEPAAAKPAQPAKSGAPGVKLPAGVTSGNAAQKSIKFGSIDPTELQESAKSASTKVAASVPISVPVPAPAGPKPSSFAAAASGGAPAVPKPAPNPPQGNPGQQRGSYPGNQGGRQPRGPQQQVPTVPIVPQQGGGFVPQQMGAYAVAPIYPGGQPYPMPFIQPAAPGYYGQNFGQGQYPAGGFPYGSPVQAPSGPHVPQVPIQTSQPASSGAPPYSSAATSPLPSRPPAQPVVRERKILRIENPDTHEQLNLDDIKKEVAKKEKAAGDKEAPAKEEELKADDGKAPGGGPKSFKDKLTESKPETEVGQTQQDGVSAVEEVAKEEVVAPKEPEAKVDVPIPSAAPVDAVAVEVEDESAKTTVSPFSSGEIQSAVFPEGGFDDSSGRKRYTCEFLEAVRPFCTALPPHIEAATLSALAIPPGSEKPRGPPGGPPDRDWKSGRAPPMPGPGGPPGMRGPRPGGKGPRQAIGVEADTWERGKTLPPMPQQVGYGGRGPPPGMRMSSGPLPELHKSTSAYQMGKTVSEDPEEEKAQKALKSMLNKITPQNFAKITDQIIEKINERKKANTLQGFIDQIFDKALTETTFAELYADLVSKLSPALPTLTDGEGNPVQFRRTLLNKCQDEFETGANAMKAVAEREKREQSAEKKEEISAELEEGELTDEQREQREAAAEAKRLDKEIATAEVAARKRMLGNIIFVGQLYRFGVITETVMHSCIKQLLEETENPRPEDVECLCKLLVTIGRPMDASQRSLKQADGGTVLTKDMMVVYFNRIQDLSKNEALDSRHRFMLHDLVDLRRNNWVERRKSEGPKKIEDIHRDAAMERSRSQVLDRQSSRGGRDRDMPRGPPRPPFDNRVDAPIRTMNRVGSQETFGSQGQSFRPGGRPPPPSRPAPPPPERLATEESEEGGAASVEEDGSTGVPAEEIERRVKGLLAELYNSGDVKEAIACVKELAEAQADLATIVETSLIVSLEGKGTSWENLRDLMKLASEEKVIAREQFERGVRSLLNKLDDMTVDVPKAPAQVADVLASLIAADAIELKAIGQHIIEADSETPLEGEDTMLVSSGNAEKLLGVLLQSLKDILGAEEAAAAWKATDLQHKDFMPKDDRENDAAVAKFVETFQLADVV